MKSYMTYINETKSEDVKVGDFVLCINITINGETLDLTTGNFYEVMFIKQFKDRKLFYVINDKNIFMWYSERFFTLNKLKNIKYREAKEKMKLKMIEIDPYGEEEWND